MNTKLETIEAEAEVLKKIDEQLKGLSPDVRKEAFQILVSRHLGGISNRGVASPPGQVVRKRTAPKSASHLAVVKDLNLKREGQTPSLREFHAEKGPRTFYEQNTVFVYYLNRLKEIEGVTPDHVFTCYKEVGARVPGAFYQSLVDTARMKGWIDTRDTGQMKITTVGENFVEHDLPRGNSE